MQLTPKLQQFISGHHGLAIGTRDATMTPDFARVLGAHALNADQVICFIDSDTSETAITNIKDNGIVTLVVASVTTFESYQLKGRCVEHRPANADEHAKVDQYLDGISALMEKALGLPPRLGYHFPHTELHILVMEVEEVFEQTPKQGTGNKLN